MRRARGHEPCGAQAERAFPAPRRCGHRRHRLVQGGRPQEGSLQDPRAFQGARHQRPDSRGARHLDDQGRAGRLGHGQQERAQVPQHIRLGSGVLAVRPSPRGRHQHASRQVCQETRHLRGQRQGDTRRL